MDAKFFQIKSDKLAKKYGGNWWPIIWRLMNEYFCHNFFEKK